MSRPHHSHAHAVAADESAHGTSASPPPPRNSVEDADASFTRKRPRLHSGGTSIRAMSTDPLSASPQEQQVEMTIRPHPPSSPASGHAEEGSDVDDLLLDAQPDEAGLPAPGENIEDPSRSPPIMVIDDDDDDDDDDDEVDAGFSIQLDAEDYFRQFPYASRGDYSDAVHGLPQHFQGSSPIDPELLPLLAEWLNELPDAGIDLHGFFVSKAVFWDDFGTLVNKLLARRYAFGDLFAGDLHPDVICCDFLSSYVRLCSLLFLADVSLLARPRPDDVYTLPLLSQKHIQCLYKIFRPDKAPVFLVLQKEYSASPKLMSNRLQKDFIKANGAQNLLRLAHAMFHQVPPTTQNTYALIVSQLLWFMFWHTSGAPAGDTYVDRAEYYRGVLRFFQTYSRDLQDASKVTDANSARDLIQHYGNLLHELLKRDRKILAEVEEDLLAFSGPDSPTSSPPVAPVTSPSGNYRQDPAFLPGLAMTAWKFKILSKYIVKGNMALRVLALATMDAALLDIWKEFNISDLGAQHPFMQYLADFLLQSRLVDYIVSVDSHPQLISRSGNIVGFLIVTCRWSDEQADAIWRTVSNSPDPRVVTATIGMLRTICNLMQPMALLYFCLKLHDLPIDRYNMDILRFLRELSLRLAEKTDSTEDFDQRGPDARPWNVCVRMMRDTAPSRLSNKSTSDLFMEANDQIHYWISTIPLHERHAIYRRCAQHIADRSSKATGSVRVMYLLIAAPDHGDDEFFQQNRTLIRCVLEEISDFIEAEKVAGPYSLQLQALECRLDLLRVIICRPAIQIPVDLYESLWDHVVGVHAISTAARDLAWTKFLEANRGSPGNALCQQLISTYVPAMPPALYTLEMFTFVASYTFPLTRRKIQSGQGEKSVLQIPGADLLWAMLLSSPCDIIADRAARHLARRYADIIDSLDVALPEVEDAHVALVQLCMQEISVALGTQSSPALESLGTDNKDVRGGEQSQQVAEIRTRRILLFLKLLLDFVRRKPEYNRGHRIDSKVDDLVSNIPFGDAITIRYQCGNDRQSVTMAADHSLNDLHTRLCDATGYTNVNLFARGQRLKLAEQGAFKVSEVDFGGQVIVQRADGANRTRSTAAPVGGSSVFEASIIKHFDEVFSWMNSDSQTSFLLYDFLSVFPVRGTFADSVTQDAISSKDLFPAGKVYQARYAAQDLENRLQTQIRNSELNEDFLSKTVQHLDKALLDVGLIREPTPSVQELQLAAVLVRVLLEFLRERPSAEVSSGYFSDPPSLVKRLLRIVFVALDTAEFTTVANDTYATILEASLHSRAMWEAFINHADAQRAHRMLLLAQPNSAIRQGVAQKISSICGGDLPSTCPITKAEIAARFWALLSAVLPDTVKVPGQSQQFFKIADQVFRTNDEYDRNEDSLRSSLTHWSTLLLEHDHRVFPGREETDHVVFGLTKLLLGCIVSLKSFKKPVNAGSLMAQVFRKHLFVSSTEAGNSSLPILETHTRQELYDLMLGLAEDSNTHATLLQLAGEVEHDETGPVLSPNLVDRADEIRSGTGYVGLYNPRALCYMNSLLTQLFMNMNFREFILGLEVKEARGSQRLLAETQNLFAQMQNSFRKSTDPRDFAACVNSLDKTPIDISIQMDADEFYNLLFDQWEAQLIKPEHKQRFRSFYGGQILNQIKSKECEHVSERAEPFFAVQCDVSGKATLQESLQAYIEGDVMEGDNKYKCESCDGKFVDAVKRTCLKDVPDNLILHLKRFEFDLIDLSRRKIYDHFAFPETLDVSPYTIDHLADPSRACKEDLFDLVGVLVHTGTCENGHYYSYIRERPSPGGVVTPNWVEFNDSDVGPFNPEEIGERSFGGPADGDAYMRHFKPYSAYMLFYQRRTAIEDDQRRWITSVSNQSTKVAVPRPLEDAVNVNNAQFIREYCLFDPIHPRFLRQLYVSSRAVNHATCTEDHERETKAIHLLLTHLAHTAWRQQSAGVFVDLLAPLRRSMLSCSACCEIGVKWLAADDHALTNLLIKCGQPQVRVHVRSLLLDSLRYLHGSEPASYGTEGSDDDMEIDTSTSPESVLSTLIGRLRTTANETTESVRGWDDYYLMMCQIAKLGHKETAMLLNHGFLEFCLKLFCMQQHEPFREEAPELARIMGKRTHIFNKLIAFSWKLLSQTSLRLPIIHDSHIREREATFDREAMRFPLTQLENEMLFHFSSELKAIVFFDKLLELYDDDPKKMEQYYPGDIIRYLLETRENTAYTRLLQTVREGILLDRPFCDNYIRVALPFCEACPIPGSIDAVISAVSTAIKKTGRVADDSAPAGRVVLGFLHGLLKAENPVLFEKTHAYVFHHYLMVRSHIYGIPLLCHYDESVRVAAHGLFEQLYGMEEAFNPDTMAVKYASIRELLPAMMHRFNFEQNINRYPSFLAPLNDACRVLVDQLYHLTQTEDPDERQFLDVNDPALVVQYQQEIEPRLRVWPAPMDGAPLSPGEPFDQSDYSNESDDGHDYLED